jgi:3'-phosphoadenosine 5'-phosphosulfate (PAPS) 3'-phosphatase
MYGKNQCFSHTNKCRYGEEWGLTMPEGGSDYVWVLDPIDGTKSFITGTNLSHPVHNCQGRKL